MNEKQPLKDRIKFWLIDKATGAVLPRLMIALLAATATGVMHYYSKAVESFPAVAGIIDPQTAVDLVSQLVVAIALLAIAKWTGRPVREWQEKLAKAGCYYGRQDGALGPETSAAFAKAINRPQIAVQAGRLVNLNHEQ